MDNDRKREALRVRFIVDGKADASKGGGGGEGGEGGGRGGRGGVEASGEHSHLKGGDVLKYKYEMKSHIE